MSKSLSTQLWGAHFPGSSLSDTEVFPKLVSPWGAEHLLLVACEGHRAKCPAQAQRLDAVLDVLSNNASQVLDWQRPKL